MLWLLSGYMWLYVHRPFENWPWLGEAHLERMYMIATLLCWLFASKKWISNRLNMAFLAFALSLVVCWLVSPYHALGTNTVEDYLKVGVFYVLVMSTVRDEQSLRKLVIMYLVAVALYMTHSLWEYHNGRHTYKMGIERLVGVDTSYGDPNSFSATLVYSLPLTFPFWKRSASAWVRALLVAYTGLTLVCISLTGSRSGFVGLCGLGLLCILGSRHRLRWLLLLALAAPLGWSLLPADMQNRYLTIIDPSYGPENAQVSAEARSQGFYDGIALWDKSPLTGFGPGAFGKATGRLVQGDIYLESHNLYGQVLGELGTLGAVALAAILFGFARNTLETRRLGKANPALQKDFAYQLSFAIAMVIVLLLFLGIAGHNLYRYTWLWFGAFQAIALHCLKLKAKAAVGPPNLLGALQPAIAQPLR